MVILNVDRKFVFNSFMINKELKKVGERKREGKKKKK